MLVALLAFAVAGGMCVPPVVNASSSPAQLLPRVARTLAEWDFNRDGDLEGWQPNTHLTRVGVRDGALLCRGSGPDPILELRRPIEFRTSPWQMVEVRLRADRDGTAELFWSNTDQGRYGGFTQAKSTRFSVVGDGQWRTYQVLPFWHPEDRIIRLRIDLYDGANFALDSFCVREIATSDGEAISRFDFTKSFQGWQPLSGLVARPDRRGLVIRSLGDSGWLLSPPMRVAARSNNVVSLRMAVDGGRHATLWFATEQDHGLKTLPFRVFPDNRRHWYNIEMHASKGWRGEVVALGLRPSDSKTAKATLESLEVGDRTHGPPEVRMVSFGFDNALVRAGRTESLNVVIINAGAAAATNVSARLSLPREIGTAEGTQPEQRVGFLGPYQTTNLTWKVAGRGPFSGDAVLELRAAGAEKSSRPGEHARPVRTGVPLRFTFPARLPPSRVVPAPNPVKGPYEVGVYYFPGWHSDNQWRPIRPFPERKPALGWYREGDPEVADWHIKWAVDHGITFFAYDWYWSRGARQLEHALHDGYLRSRYRHMLKFCLLWANHNPPGTSSREDCLAVTKHWISNYFTVPEYLKHNGKPVVIIFSPDRLRADMGSAAVRSAFDAMRAECNAAGLDGLYLAACIGDTGQARQAADEGYDAVTAYNWPDLGLPAGQLAAPYASLINAYRSHWESLLHEAFLPLILPVNGGWDSRPWHGDNNIVRYGRTPGLFKQHLRDARRVLDAHKQRDALPGIILIEAWNEWGEGSYIEPHSEFGFGYLDAIRQVFTRAPVQHDDVIPADVGLGPYDVRQP